MQNREGPVKKKNILIFMSLMLLLSLCACGNRTEKQAETAARPLRIVAAIFPAWDWTKNILGENPANAELTLLLDNGVDLHSFQPSVEDILTISGADLFIYVGGESDQWVTDALKQTKNPELHVISMLDILGEAAHEEELKEGMQAEAEPEEEAAYDEHVWLSLRSASVICSAVSAELSALDPDHAAVYEANVRTYQEKLKELDQAYALTISECPLKTLLFGDRFPFRYLVEDYGLDYYAAFSGCSAETEASFETVTFLAQKAAELSLPAVLTIDGTDHRIAETIVRNTKGPEPQILTLDSMQSVSAKDIENGTTYLSVMEKDLEVLKQALQPEEK